MSDKGPLGGPIGGPIGGPVGWTIGELAERAALALRAGSDGAPALNGRVRDVPGERLIRWYTTIGLVDPPLTRRGRIAQYGRRHLLQLVAVKRLQAAGHSIAEIQTALAGATDRMLETAAGLAPASGTTSNGTPGIPDAASGTPRVGTSPVTGARRDRRGIDPSEAPDDAHPGNGARPGRGAAERRTSERDAPRAGGDARAGGTRGDGARAGGAQAGGDERAGGARAGGDERAGGARAGDARGDDAQAGGARGGGDERAGGDARVGGDVPAGADVRARGDEVLGTAGAGRDRQGGVRGDREPTRGRFWAERPGKGSGRAPEAADQPTEPADELHSRPSTPDAPGRARSPAPGGVPERVPSGVPETAPSGVAEGGRGGVRGSGPGGPGGAVVVGVRLGDGVRLVLDAGRVPSEEDVQAVLAAAGPLLAVLEEKELI
ncbi:MerR family transcriptional regulator [Nonomuraea jabiensis]|uniref:DNA-binding transcriptional MerR regulator n=1 Tax=Nonomuraea jabiensis TaxID=882448 RepID=A0A7W9G9K2_9ACTN|nr:MerR family transcriptional regulator [Nonomuraea jabiensis]MBB5779633.1 DNA-binding transcriptional MerR regulator [Nonomuraea jabiensis]